ncbi:uncharacterized protein LOC124897931 [Capsicum annuum]|uniref:uncharacterized protein LOC124897931 n=1 Tax=Capsicum annuum TaxID=4072 RepID=UPI001FB0508F|nr:uncharacterized protein LOC124897931 [Capsicum annuum]
MAKMMTQLEILTKRVMGAPVKVVNAMESKSYKDDEDDKNLDEEIRPKGGHSSDTIAISKNNAQVLEIVTRSVKTHGDHLKEDLGEKVLKIKTKDVPPQSHDKEENEKESMKVDDEVVKGEKPQKDMMPTIHVPPPFPQRLHRKEEGDKLKKFMDKLSNLLINNPLLKVIQGILGYANLMKNLMSKKKIIEAYTIEVTHGYSSIMCCRIMEKKEDPGAFTILSIIGTHMFVKTLCDLGVSINLMTFFIYKNLGLDTPPLISMRLFMEDRSIKRPIGILFDISFKVNKFILSTDFVVLDCGMDQEVPIILSQPFLAIRRAIVDLELGDMRFRVHEREVSFEYTKQENNLRHFK